MFLNANSDDFFLFILSLCMETEQYWLSPPEFCLHLAILTFFFFPHNFLFIFLFCGGNRLPWKRILEETKRLGKQLICAELQVLKLQQ